LTLAAAICGCLYLTALALGKVRREFVTASFVLQFFLAVAPLMYYELRGQNFLQLLYLHYITFCAALLALFAILSALCGSRLDSIPLPGILALTLLIVVPAQCLMTDELREAIRVAAAQSSGVRSLEVFRFLIPTTLCLAGFVAAFVVRGRYSFIFPVAGFAALMVLGFPGRQYASPPCYSSRDQFQLVISAVDALSSRSVGWRTLIWYPFDETVVWKKNCPGEPARILYKTLWHASLVTPASVSLPMASPDRLDPASLELERSAIFLMASKADKADHYRGLLLQMNERIKKTIRFREQLNLPMGVNDTLALQIFDVR
jgi:hypothetical protein